MNDILNKIVMSRFRDVNLKTSPVAELKARYKDRQDFRSFHASLREKIRQDHVAIIAECKRGSPSRGLFAPDLDPGVVAKEYETGMASCLSVLTEPYYFFGSIDDLLAARKSCTLPILQKDFIVTEYQIYEAAIHADAILLIARCLEASQLKDLHDLATALKLDVLVEVFDENDVELIEPFHFPLVGINNRNLKTMDVSFEHSHKLFSCFDAEQTVVAASGVKSRQDVERFMKTGFRCFLIGESLSTASDRVGFLRHLITGESPC